MRLQKTKRICEADPSEKYQKSGTYMHHGKAIANLSGEKGDIKSLKKLLHYLRPYKMGLTGVVIALLITSSSVLGIGKGLGFLIDRMHSGNPALLHGALFTLLGIAIVLALGTYARFYLITYVGERVVADIRRDLYAHIIRLSPEFFETTKTGDVLSRLTADTELFQLVVGSSLSIALRNTVMFFGGVALLVFTSPKLFGLVALIIPLVVFPIIKIGRKVRALSRATQERISTVSSCAEETLSGIKTVQAYTREELEKSRFQECVDDTFNTAMRRIKMRALLTAIVIFFVFAAVIAVLWMGGQDVLAGKMSAGELSSFLFYAVIVATATGAISEVVGDLQRAAGAAERLFELLHTEPTIKEVANPTALPIPAKGAISFNQITFHYPARPQTASLEDFSLDIKPGETVALVGPSGAGKSTVFQLLLRFYDAQSGTMKLEDVDIRTLRLEELRNQFALVSQDPVIFSTTALENIRFARPEATEEEVIAAAKAASAMEFIEQLPEGLNTFLGEKGVRISGGQKQRIAIARAILKDPCILLLDEATSALDSANERQVQSALEKLSKDRTTLIIAHRLSTVQNADRIVVINEGRIEAIGTHSTLSKENGLYAKLAKLQFEAA